MAIKRENIENAYSEVGKTTSPLDDEKKNVKENNSSTFDSHQIGVQYNEDSQTGNNKVNTGTFIPQDMTVRLVRADSANSEIFLSTLYSLSLTLFGIFLGSWLSESEATFTTLEIIATFFFLILSIILIIIWVIIKVKQRKNGVLIPQDMVNTFKKTGKEKP